MKIKILLSVIAINVLLFAACKKSSDEETKPDTTAPVITLNGSAKVSIAQFAAYSDAGATAADNVDGSVSVSNNAGSTNPDKTKIGVYVITYTATDKAGNTSTASRSVSVGYSQADFISWTNGNGYSATDSDLVTHVKSPFTGCDIVAGAGANDIKFGCFFYSLSNCNATINGAFVTLTGEQTFYPNKISGAGVMNNSKNVITLYCHDSYENHDHIITLTKL